MFFTLSKVLWWIAAPGNALLIVLCIGTLMLFTSWRRAGRWIVALATLLALVIAFVPLGYRITLVLENRFPASPALPEHVDGIVALGGVVNMQTTQARGQTAVEGPIERLIAFAKLGHRYPEARLIFTGGTAKLSQGLREADFVGPVLAEIGFDPKRVIYDNQARNTHENAVLAKKLADPQPGETWVLITSAVHMPRSVGCFRKAGWKIIPYPVDFHTGGQGDGDWFAKTPAFAERLRSLEAAVYELLGLLAYRLTDRTDTLFPGPETNGS